ncbi:MAG: hypothetical protein ABI542_12895 [Gemmatimonadota bacterium]
MSNLSLFIVGVLVMIPATAGVAGLVLAALADGRENDRIHREEATEKGRGL